MIGSIELNGELYIWRLIDELVTVFAPDNRHKATQLGGSAPDSIVRILARELAGQKNRFLKKYPPHEWTGQKG